MPAPEPIVIEADTAEEALAEVHHLLGADAEIVEARKVLRGGWRGFFATERVELLARPRTVAAPPVAEGELEATRAQLDAEAERDRADFDRMLRRILEEAPEPAMAGASAVTGGATTVPPPVAPAAPPAPAVEEPAPVEEPVEPPAPRRPAARTPAASAPAARKAGAKKAAARPTELAAGGVAWSVDALAGLRLPWSLIAACEDLDPNDDAAWVGALSDAVTSWCRPLPTGDPALVGPRVRKVAKVLDVPVVGVGTGTVPAGPVALEAPDSLEGRTWAVDAVGDRWLHVVAAGRRWEWFAFEDALAISWAHPSQLPLVLSVADRLGLVLGYGMVGGGLVRATPVDVALAIRAQLPRA